MSEDAKEVKPVEPCTGWPGTAGQCPGVCRCGVAGRDRVVPNIEQMGVEVTDQLEKIEEASDAEVLRRFAVLPKLFSGRRITIEFLMGRARSAFPEDCIVLNLEPGATVACQVTLDSGQAFTVYGERDIALDLLSLPDGSAVKARANTVYGDGKDVQWTDDGPIPTIRSEMGLVIKEILSAEMGRVPGRGVGGGHRGEPG